MKKATPTPTTVVPKKKKKMKLRTKFGLAVMGAAAFTSLGWAAGDYNSESTVQATVNYAAQSGSNDSSYVVYTNKGMYTDNDSYLKMKFNSDEVYKDLRPGCSYEFNVHGWTPNIDKATFVSTPTCPIAPPKTTYGVR